MSQIWDTEQGVSVQVRLKEKEVLNLRNVVLFALENQEEVENYLDVKLNTNTLEVIYDMLSNAKKIMIGG
jgi:hypothetical protein